MEAYPVLTTSDGDGTQCELEESALRGFAYLEHAWGIAGTIDRDGLTSVVSYVGPEIVLEIQFDWRERFAIALVADPGPNGRPDGYFVHQGRVVRMYLGEALDTVLGRGNDSTERLRAVTQKSGFDGIRDQIETTCAVMHEHHAAIVAHRHDLFPAE